MGMGGVRVCRGCGCVGVGGGGGGDRGGEGGRGPALSCMTRVTAPPRAARPALALSHRARLERRPSPPPSSQPHPRRLSNSNQTPNNKPNHQPKPNPINPQRDSLDKMVEAGLTLDPRQNRERTFQLRFPDCDKLPPPVLPFQGVSFGYSGNPEGCAVDGGERGGCVCVGFEGGSRVFLGDCVV